MLSDPTKYPSSKIGEHINSFKWKYTKEDFNTKIDKIKDKNLIDEIKANVAAVQEHLPKLEDENKKISLEEKRNDLLTNLDTKLKKISHIEDLSELDNLINQISNLSNLTDELKIKIEEFKEKIEKKT